MPANLAIKDGRWRGLAEAKRDKHSAKAETQKHSMCYLKFSAAGEN